MRDPAPDSLAAALDRLIAQRSFDIHFQPLVAIDRAEIFAYEALTRAPADGPLHSPLVLFETAARCGRLIELEQLIVRRAAGRFKALGLPGQLFLNVTADTLLAARDHVGALAQELRELTETRPIEDLAQLDGTLAALRAHGFRVALDDLGEGFASLRRWIEMRPDFVKIDRHFIDGIAQEPDLEVLRRLGITICQGYLFARPIGVLRSLQVLKRSTERYFMDIFAKRSFMELMDARPLVFDVSTPLRAMSDAVANLDERLLMDGFIVTRDGAYFGSGRSSDLLKAVSDPQVHSARYANPLTLLPGNVPIDNHLDRLIEGGEAFLAAVWDIDHFKPFNDVYGYRVGDDIIRLAARVLTQAVNPQIDFVGHIGGDDFVMVLRSADWEDRLDRVCAAFDAGVRSFFSAEHLAAGGYVTLNRQNQPSFHPLPTISCGALLHQAGSFDSARALAAALAEPKRVAKGRAGGSRFFVDRRQPATHRISVIAPHEPAEIF